MRWMPGAASRSNVDPLTTRAYPRAAAKNRRPGGLVPGVGLQVGHRVDRMAAPVPLAEPELEVKVQAVASPVCPTIPICWPGWTTWPFATEARVARCAYM